jgi:K+-sensing histidine kinase KdpD
VRHHWGVLRRRSWNTGLVASVVAVAVVTAVIYGLREIVPVVSTGVVYLLAVLLVSTGWGLWSGLVTAFLSAAAFNFFHIPPTGEFSIEDGEHWVALGVFLVAAVVVSGLSDLARSRAEEAERQRGEADLAAEMARILLAARSWTTRFAPWVSESPPPSASRRSEWSSRGWTATSGDAPCRCLWRAPVSARCWCRATPPTR